jgi:tetratricopeptide (TPR) repeat protein
MPIDADNPVMRICAEGMSAEAEGAADKAKALFEQAQEAASDDYERCIAAHYLARHQDGPAQRLHWNAECLRFADIVGDERVAGFYPSLYLNMGHSYEQLGDREKAEECYHAAESHFSALPDGPYGDMVRDGVARGLQRLSE